MPTWLDHAYHWVEANWRQVVGGIAAIAVVAAAVVLGASYLSSSDEKAKEMLFLAQKAAGQGMDAVPDLEKVIKEYPSSAPAQIARLELGNLYISKGDLAKAEEVISPVAKAKETVFKVLGLNNLAAVRLLNGDAKGAAEAYMQAYNNAKNPARGMSYFNAALAYKKAGDVKTARKIFEELSEEADEFSTPELREQSQEQLIWMAVK
jgi:tetratricopeptide (TPR) repeat protein